MSYLTIVLQIVVTVVIIICYHEQLILIFLEISDVTPIIFIFVDFDCFDLLIFTVKTIIV